MYKAVSQILRETKLLTFLLSCRRRPSTVPKICNRSCAPSRWWWAAMCLPRPPAAPTTCGGASRRAWRGTIDPSAAAAGAGPARGASLRPASRNCPSENPDPREVSRRGIQKGRCSSCCCCCCSSRCNCCSCIRYSVSSRGTSIAVMTGDDWWPAIFRVK